MARRPRTSAAKAAKAAPRGQVPRLSEDAKGLLEAANESSGGARNAWIAFLALITYLLVTLGGVSHKDLLLNSGVKLPIVNVEIPLFSFFQYAPLLLLLVLLSLLIQHVVLARKYRRFVEAIAPYEKKDQKEHPAHELVHSYVVSQLLAGPKRNPVTRCLMRLMVFVTFALLPILTLLYFQIKFIPYHEVWVTYWHRIMVLLGLGLLFALLPIIQLKSREQGVKLGPQGEAWRASPFGIALGATTAILVVGFSWVIATVPDERLDQLTGFPAPKVFVTTDDAELLNPLVRFVFDRTPEADLGTEGWFLRWLVSYRVLVAEGEDLVPDESDKYGEVSVVLRERNLQFAKLSRSDLHRADLTRADLRGAQMLETRLEKARLEGAKLQGASLSLVKLQGADLSFANFEDTDLGSAKLQGADLASSHFEGADLGGAELQGADLSSTHFEGADLSSAKFQGADLADAKIWLVGFPRGLGNQSPGPLGVADPLDLSPLTAEAKADLKQDLKADITDPKLLKKVTAHLDPILRDDPPKWEDEARWSQYISQATEPAPDQLVPFLADLACGNPDSYIAKAMAKRAERYSRDKNRLPYAKPLAEALLDKNCEGAKALSAETRAELEDIVAATE